MHDRLLCIPFSTVCEILISMLRLASMKEAKRKSSETSSRWLRDNVFEILYRHPHLSAWDDAEDAIVELFLNHCSSDEERALILHLLLNFTFIDDGTYSRLLQRGLDEAIHKFGLIKGETAFCAATADKSADSGQRMLSDLKICKPNDDWTGRFYSINQIGKVRGLIQKHKAITNVVIVDHFAGTGNTLESRYRSVFNELRQERPIQIGILVLASMPRAKNLLESRKIPFVSPLSLKRGLTDTMKDEERRRACRLMLAMENRIKCEKGGYKFHHFGYGWSQSLFTIHGVNTSNNVFPFFWWPFSADGCSRDTLLRRTEDGFDE